MRRPVRNNGTRQGFSLLEILIALTILSLVMSGFLFAMHGEVARMQSMATMSYNELRGKDLLSRLQDELAYARLVTPESFLTADFGGARVQVNSSAGFPDEGTLLFAPGQPSEERVRYSTLAANGTDFLDIDRAQACTAASAHGRGAIVRWAGTAHFIEDQSAPPASTYDGVSQELFGPRFFRGDGTGVGFQTAVPVAEGRFDGPEVRWGCTVDARAVVDGYSVLRFDPVATLTEADRNFDFNRDGDRDDSFDLGAIHMRSWNPSSPADVTDVALCPPMILQETCAPAADLDADGFEDPIFLFDRDTGWLRVRLFVLAGSIQSIPVVRRLETSVYIRNPNEN